MPSPAIFWDGYGLTGLGSGIAVHGRKLRAALLRLGLEPTTVVPFGELCDGRKLELQARGRLARTKLLWPGLVGRAMATLVGNRSGGTILHGLSNFNIPRGANLQGISRVLTVHDLIPLLLPREVAWTLSLQMAYLMPRAIAAADAIVCVSNWTARSVEERFPFARGKCVVIPNGIEATSGRLEQVPQQPEGWGDLLRLLTVARGETYKRLVPFLEVVRARGGSVRWTVVTDGAGWKAIESAASDLVGAGTVELRSNVPDGELTALFDRSDAYVQPSRLEGYCLPAATALARGKPVLYRMGSGMDEVVSAGCSVGVRETGDGLSGPAFVEAWLDGIERVSLLLKGEAFAHAAVAQWSSLPTWDHSARAHQKLYNDLASR